MNIILFIIFTLYLMFIILLDIDYTKMSKILFHLIDSIP